MRKRERTPAAIKEKEYLRDCMGYLVLQEDCEQLSEEHGVTTYIEETKGKTKFLHIEGTSAKIDRFLDDLYRRTRGVPVKWITIPYKGVFRKWKYKKRMNKMKQELSGR